MGLSDAMTLALPTQSSKPFVRERFCDWVRWNHTGRFVMLGDWIDKTVRYPAVHRLFARVTKTLRCTGTHDQAAVFSGAFRHQHVHTCRLSPAACGAGTAGLFLATGATSRAISISHPYRRTIGPKPSIMSRNRAGRRQRPRDSKRGAEHEKAHQRRLHGRARHA
jgi:hypothetical protein